MRTVLAAGIAIAASVAGCKKEAAAPGASAPASTTDQDALWTLAPDGARFGLVVSPRGVAMIERAAIAVEALLDAAPELAPVRDQLQKALTRGIGSTQLRLTEVGLTPDKGFAVFALDKGESVAVLPVADRDKFLAKVHGKKGTDVDELDGDSCKTVSGLYICVAKPELFARLGKNGLGATLRTAGARGDIEFAGHDFTGPKDPTVAVVAQLDRGAFVMRGVVAGVPPSVGEMIGAPSRPRAGSGGAAGFGSIDLTPYLAKLPAAVPIAPGITLGDLRASIAGPATFVIAAGTNDPDLRLPLKDPAPVKALLEHCTDLPPLAMIGATVNQGACHVPIASLGLALDGWIDGNQLRIGNRSAGTAATLTPSPLAEELSAGDWAVAFFGRGSYLTVADLPQVASILKELPTEGRMFLRGLPLFSELGFGVRQDAANLRFVFGVRTAWSNPEDVIAKLLAITSDDWMAGKAGQIGKSIADGAPSSPFAQDFRAGTLGVMGIALPIGAMAGVAIPAFMDYMKHSRTAPPP